MRVIQYIFRYCGVCGKKVIKGNHIGINLKDDDFEETWQWYHPKCYGSRFNNVPRKTTQQSTASERIK